MRERNQDKDKLMNGNGDYGPKKNKRASDSRPMPGLNVRELIEERNWSALAGLALIGLALLSAFQSMFDVDFNLWSLLLLGLGGWLLVDTYKTYEQQGRTWAENTRNRMLAGALIGLIGLMGMFDINWWGLLLIGVGGWLGYDTNQQVQSMGGVWTDHLRNRMIAAAVIGGLGLFGFLNLGSTWPVILIVIGIAMLYRHFKSAH